MVFAERKVKQRLLKKQNQFRHEVKTIVGSF